jgi:hypothetical protein
MAASTTININDNTILKLVSDLSGYAAPAEFAGATAGTVEIDAKCGKTLDNGHTAASYLNYTLTNVQGNRRRAFRFQYTDTEVYFMDLWEDEIVRAQVTNV